MEYVIPGLFGLVAAITIILLTRYFKSRDEKRARAEHDSILATKIVRALDKYTAECKNSIMKDKNFKENLDKNDTTSNLLMQPPEPSELPDDIDSSGIDSELVDRLLKFKDNAEKAFGYSKDGREFRRRIKGEGISELDIEATKIADDLRKKHILKKS